MGTSPHFVRKKLINSKEAYIESVGREDMATLGEVFDAPNGKGNVLRLIFGATKCMPLRALSYVESAVRIAQILPNQQLQVIFANNLGSSINGHNLAQVREQSVRCAAVSRMMIVGHHQAMAQKVGFYEDKPNEQVELIRPKIEAMLSLGDSNTAKLNARGERHNGDHISYTAAHIVYQDTDCLDLTKLSIIEPDPVTPERIVSIGSQKEIEFYKARMAGRLVVDEMQLLPTAQIFTRHVVPPYFMSRGGEQSLDDAMMNGVDLSLCNDDAARRDLTHFVNMMGAKNE